jgi:hypothetical protein
MGCVFGFAHEDMLETAYSAFNVSRHGYVTRAIDVVSLEGQTAKPGAGPIETDFIQSFERGN